VPSEFRFQVIADCISHRRRRAPRSDGNSALTFQFRPAWPCGTRSDGAMGIAKQTVVNEILANSKSIRWVSKVAVFSQSALSYCMIFAREHVKGRLARRRLARRQWLAMRSGAKRQG
jgi:hypothetical protein